MVIVVSALRSESAALLSLIGQQRRIGTARIPMILGRINRKAIGIVHCGVALAQGRKSLLALLQRWRPQLLLNIGCAGSLTDAVAQYSLFVPSTYFLMQYPALTGAVGVTYRTPSALCATLVAGCKLVGRCYSGGLVTVPQAVLSPYERRRLLHLSGAQTVDMEGARLASVAQRLQIPLGCIKWISDTPQQYHRSTASQTMPRGSAMLAAVLRQLSLSCQWANRCRTK